MKNENKKSRKAVKLYTLNSSAGEVQIDLNNYTAKCSVSGEPKQFYHTYLANMIATKYGNDISIFESTYVSRASRPKNSRRLEIVKSRINRLYDQIRTLKTERDEINQSV